MCKEFKTMCDINVTAGTNFNVTLECNPSSTGYSWTLAHMPDSVNLLDISHETSNSLIFGVTTNQVFTFAALEACQDSLAFNLVRPWEASNPAEQRVHPLTIVEAIKTEADELEASIGKDKFVDACASSTCYATNFGARPYMAPFNYSCNANISPMLAMYMPICLDMVQNQKDCMVAGNVKYAPPAIYKYAAPTNYKYAAPIKAEDSSSECTNKSTEDEPKED
jgi:predicted secreted protein